jgi:hypothetical protein
VINDLIEQGRLSGTIQGRQDKANFVPDIYSRTQNAWVDAFYQQNGYLGKFLCLYVVLLLIYLIYTLLSFMFAFDIVLISLRDCYSKPKALRLLQQNI